MSTACLWPNEIADHSEGERCERIRLEAGWGIRLEEEGKAKQFFLVREVARCFLNTR
jgi:hypothetical protein